MLRRVFAAVFLLALISSRLGSAAASGIALREGSVDWVASAFAGQTAKAYDASTSFSNPAGMTRLDSNEFDVSGSLIAPYASFSGSNLDRFGQRTPGAEGGNPLEQIAVPGAFGVWSLSQQLKLGVAITSPFGERLAYPADFVGRYQSLVSSVSDVQLSLTAAYRLNEHLSVGVGPVISILGVRLTQALNIGPLSARLGEPVADFSGGDVAVGFAIGALYEVDESTRLGLTYRSRLHHRIEGTQTVFLPAALRSESPSLSAFLLANTGPARTEVTLPDSVSIGFYKQLDERWSIAAEIQWTDWSLIKTLVIAPAGASSATILREHWRDTWFGAVGAGFQLNEKILLQTGVGYDLSPVTDNNRTTRVPDSNRLLLGGGLTFSVLTNVKLQFAVLEAIGGTAKIDNSASASAGIIRGTYQSHATVIGVGAAIRF